MVDMHSHILHDNHVCYKVHMMMTQGSVASVVPSEDWDDTSVSQSQVVSLEIVRSS